MALYSFFPDCSPPDASPPLEVELAHDLAALRYAGEILARHPWAARLTVLEGERHVAHLTGAGAGAQLAETMSAITESRARIEASWEVLRSSYEQG